MKCRNMAGKGLKYKMKNMTTVLTPEIINQKVFNTFQQTTPCVW